MAGTRNPLAELRDLNVQRQREAQQQDAQNAEQAAAQDAPPAQRERKPLIALGSILPPRDTPDAAAPSSEPSSDAPAPDLMANIIARDRARRQPEGEPPSNLSASHDNLIESDKPIKKENYHDSMIESKQDSKKTSYNDNKKEATPEEAEEGATVQLNARVPAALAKRFKVQAVTDGETTQALIRRFIVEYLEAAQR